MKNTLDQMSQTEKQQELNRIRIESKECWQPAAASKREAHNTIKIQFQIYFTKWEISLILATGLSFEVY